MLLSIYIYKELDFEDVFNVVDKKFCGKMKVLEEE